MRKIGLGLVLLALAVGFGISAEAGPANGKTVGLYVGHYPNPAPDGGDSEIVKPPVQVGTVRFLPSGDKMRVRIILENGQPNTTFQVFLVHQSDWGTVSEQGYSMTTNGSGRAVLRFKRDIPDDAKNNVFIKAIVRVNRYGPVYVTGRHHIPLKKKW